MNFSRMIMIGIFFVGLGGASHVEAMSIVSFADYDFTQLRYDNRIRISADSSDDDFMTENSIDSNNDGVIDLLEQETFVVQGESASLFLGNAHNRYDIARSLLFVGIDGELGSFSVNDIHITSDEVTSVTDPGVFFVNAHIAELLDQVVLFEITTKLEDRNPNGSPLGENEPFEVILSDIVSSDTSLRMYCGAYGFIASGAMNSYTPNNSSVLFLPESEGLQEEERDDATTSEPVPEPAILFMFGTAVAYLLMKERRSL